MWVKPNNRTVGGQKALKFRRLLYALILLFMSSVWGLADTTIPMKLNVSAVLRYSDGTEINTLTPEDIKIGLYLSDTEFVWQKTYSVTITNGLIEAVLSGTGTDSNGGSVVLNESLFEHENLKVGFTINEDGSEKLAIVNLTSQPYAIKSAISDVANLAEDTIKIRGVPIMDQTPESKDVLVYVEGEWMPTGLDNTMMNIDEYRLVTNDVTEISGTFENLKVEKILGKKLVTSVRNGSRIPTGAILMFSPDVDAPNGAFHPSSGNPQKGEFLAWDHINDVWMPTINALQKLDDVVPPVSSEGEAPSNNVLIYNLEQSRYYSDSIGLNYLSDVEVSKAIDGSFLSYDGKRWEASTLGINDLSNVNISSAPSGKVLYHDGSNWDVKTMRLQDLADLDSGLAEGKIIIGKSGNQRFEYTDFKMDALNDVNITSKEIGYVLTWTGTEWKANKNMIESINELDDFNISGSPTGKYLYHDGTTWVDQSIVLVEKAEDLSDVGFTTLESGDLMKYNGDRWTNAEIDLDELKSVELDFTGQSSENPIDKFLAFSDGKWRNTTIDFSEMTGVAIDSAESGQALVYNGSTWTGKTFALGHMSNVDTASRADGAAVENGDILEFDNGTWVVRENTLKDMVDIETGNIGANRILKMNNAGTGFVYEDYKLTELMDLDISDEPTDKYLYFDGSKWVDKEINLVTSVEELSDVKLGSVSDGQLLRYDIDKEKWINDNFDINELSSVEIDFTGQSSENPIDKFLAFSDGKWRNTTIELGEMKNVSIADASSGQSLVYNGSNWTSQILNLGNLGNVTTGKRVDGSALEEGDILEYKAGNWVVKANELKDMVDVATGNIGANRILKLNNAGSGFVYEDYKISALRDVNLSDEASGRYLYYDGSEWIDKELNLVTSVQELSDVSLGTVADNQLLKYDLNREKWVNSELAFNEITEVELDFTGQSQISPIDKFLVFENGKWRNSTIDIGEMQNVNVDSAVTGNVLKYNGKAWVNGSPVTALSALTDVSLSGINNGDILKYNADTGEWENQQESSALLISELEGAGTKKEISVKGNLLPGSGYSLGSDTNSWQSLYLESTGMMMGDNDNRAVITYNTDNKELVVQHSREDGITTSPINLRLQDGVALVGDSWETATDNIQAIAVWDGNVKNKITQSYDQLAFNSKTNAVGFGIGEPESKIHIQMTSESDIGGVRLSTASDLDSYLNIYQDELADTISGSTVLRKPYLFHANVADSASKYHDIGFMIDTKSALYMAIQKDGETGAQGYSDVDDVYVGIGTRTPSEKLEVDGKVRATSMYIGDKTETPTTNANVKLHVGGDAAVDGAIYISGGSDLAEGFHIVADKDVEPGTVVSIDPKNIGKLVVSDEAFDTKVAGVVSGGNGIKAGLVMTQTGTLADGEYPIALTGRVWVKCTNENGDIGIGDLLTTASKPGHAMKATGDNMQGAVLGKAMSTCGDNRMVLTLISLQ